MDEQKYVFPAALSFIVPGLGLGQFVKGHVLKGIAVIIGSIISFFLSFILIGFLTGFIVWVWSIYDAYNSNSTSSASLSNILIALFVFLLACLVLVVFGFILIGTTIL